ncbi:MAG: RecX family transcriptional regulator [bacterium]|nr:RecX family transcriptional regulator [bacterium]
MGTADDPREQPAGGRLLLAVRRETGAVVLVLEGGEDLELAPDAVPPDLPEAGAVLSGALLGELRLAADRKRAARRIFGILDRRLVPPARLRRRLAEDGLDPVAVEAVLEQMAQRGLYSDRHYADAWCRETLRAKAVGRFYLESNLRKKGIAAGAAKAAASDALDRETEAEAAHRAAAARWRRITGPTDRRAEGKVVRFLQSRGFGGGLAARAMRATRPTEPGADPEEER